MAKDCPSNIFEEILDEGLPISKEDWSRLLTFSGADKRSGYWPLKQIRSQFLSLMKYLVIENYATNDHTSDQPGKFLLLWAARIGIEELADCLIEKGVPVDVCNTEVGWEELSNLVKFRRGDFPLLLAARNGCAGTVTLLLAHSATTDKTDGNGQMALHVAASEGYVEIIQLLLSHNSDIAKKDLYGETALHHAVRGHHKEAVELLLARGADIRAKDRRGNTPMHAAALAGANDMCELLMTWPMAIPCESVATAIYKRTLAALCSIRHYANLPKDIIFMIFSCDKDLVKYLATILFLDFQKNRVDRKGAIRIKNDTAWRLKIIYGKDDQHYDIIILPQGSAVIDVNPRKIKSLSAMLDGKYKKYLQLRPVNLLEEVIKAEGDDIDVLIHGRKGFLSQYYESFTVMCEAVESQRATFSLAPEYWEREREVDLKDVFPLADAAIKKNKKPLLRHF